MCVFQQNMSVLSITQNRHSIFKWETLFIQSQPTVWEKIAIFCRPKSDPFDRKRALKLNSSSASI